jgi:hypothetical protein
MKFPRPVRQSVDVVFAVAKPAWQTTRKGSRRARSVVDSTAGNRHKFDAVPAVKSEMRYTLVVRAANIKE